VHRSDTPDATNEQVFASWIQNGSTLYQLKSAGRSTVMSQDTGMAMTLIGNKGFARRPPH
jgi:hypothetical protein